MDRILDKVADEIQSLAKVYEGQNVTQSMSADFLRAFSLRLDESTRIRDLEDSDVLKDEIIELFNRGKPTEAKWIYVNQPEIIDRCVATKGCKFSFGASMYRSNSCEHYTCEKHQGSVCILEEQKKPIDQETAGSKEDHQDDKQHKESKMHKDKGANYNSKLRNPDTAKDKSASDKEMEDNRKDRVDGNHEIEIKNDADSNKAADRKAEEREEILTGEKRKPTIKFQVAGIGDYSVEDFDFQQKCTEHSIFMVPTVTGETVWLDSEDFATLKGQYASLAASNDANEDSDAELIANERTHRKNANVGK